MAYLNTPIGEGGVADLLSLQSLIIDVLEDEIGIPGIGVSPISNETIKDIIQNNNNRLHSLSLTLVNKQGFFFNEVNSDGYPIDLTIRIAKAYNDYLKNAPGWIDGSALKKVLIDCSTIENSAFYNTFSYLRGNLKLKSVTSIGNYAFYYIGKNNDVSTINIYIPKCCTTITSTSDLSGMPFEQDQASNLQFYCEATEKPDGWVNNWNLVGLGYGYHNVTWGVTENQFDTICANS